MILPYFIIIPLLAAFLITLISSDDDRWAIVISILAVIILEVLSVIGFMSVAKEPIVYSMSGWDIPITVCLVLDSFSAFMLFIVSLISLAALLIFWIYINCQCSWS